MMNVLKMIKAAMFTPGLNGCWGLNVLVESEPGMGKSSMINKLREEGLYVFTLLGSIREPTDILGFGVEVDGVIKRCPEEWVAQMLKQGRAVIFMDEFNTAPLQVQSAFLRVVLERYVGETALPPTIRIIAAQNPTDLAANGHDHSPATANRWCHLKWSAPTADDWCSWLLSHDDADFGQPAVSYATFDDSLAEATEKRVLEAWPEAWAAARGVVSAFVAAKPDKLHKMPDRNNPQASKAWPSHRSWEAATRALAGASIHGLNAEETDTLICGFLGQGVAAEFAAFRARQDLPKAADVLDGKVAFEHDGMRLDRTMSVLNSCAALVTDPRCPNRQRRTAVLWMMLDALYDHAADLTVDPARSLLKAGLAQGKHAVSMLAKLDQMMVAAGVR